jgi:AraC-like DNA-binding protein
MPKTTEIDAETTYSDSGFDVLSDVFRSLRIHGSILLKEDYAAPWAVTIPAAGRLQALLKLRGGVRVVAFHYVQRGYLELTPDAGGSLVLEAGEMAICFGGGSHRLAQGARAKALPVETLLAGGGNPFQPEPAQRARSTSLLCGVFLMQDVEINPLFAALPPLLHLSAPRPGELHHLAGVLERMAQEIDIKSFGSSYVVERLLELLCAEALRAQLANATAPPTGWLSGLRDPMIGRALAMIHARPGDDWSVERLSRGVAMSASRFAARFSAALGDSPMAYVTKWRMNVAGRLLQETRQGIGEIAAEVGYENVAAFHRAFKRHIGLPPAAWRTRRHDDGEMLSKR